MVFGETFANQGSRAIAQLTGGTASLYRMGDDLVVRLPRIERVTAQIEKEQQWLPQLAAALPIAIPAPVPKGVPAEGFPWLSAAWDVRTGRWTALRLCGGSRGAKLKPGQAFAWDFKPGGGAPPRRLLRPAAFTPGIFGEPVLDRALEDFARLSPLSSLSVEDLGWALRLERPLRWAMFARCDLSAAFTPGSSQLALFLLDRSVTELSFDGEALWAHCAG